jgi:hypothetical protein
MNRNRFLPGNDGHGGGRPLGSRNKLQSSFLKALAEDFEQHGAGVIKIARIEKPVEYLKVIASVLPKELVVEQSVLTDISDDELAAHIALLQRLKLRNADKEEETGETNDDAGTTTTH